MILKLPTVYILTSIVLICTAVICAAQSDFTASPQEQTKPNSVAEANRGDSQKPYALPVRIIEQPDTKTAADSVREQQADARDEKNLLIQESLKDSATHTVALSVLQFLLAAIGTGAVLFSLRLARISTDAAVQAVEITRDMNHKQLRAYVLIDSTHLTINPDGTSTTEIIFRNGGQTPALNVEIPCMGGCTLRGQPPDFIMNKDHQASIFPLLPNGERRKEIGPWSTDRTVQLQAGLIDAWIWGEISYNDIFGHHYVSRFRLQAGGDLGFVNGFSWLVTRDGNDFV